MSLESAIAENTAALNKLITILSTASPLEMLKPPIAAIKEERVEPKKKAETVKSEGQQAPSNPAEEKPAQPEDTEITYAQTAQAVVDLSKAKGRPAAEALLAKFDATNLTQVLPEKFAEVIAAAQQAMGE